MFEKAIKKTGRLVALLGLALVLTSCASGVRQAGETEAPAYQYLGQKFGQIKIRLSPELQADRDKALRAQELNLAQAIKNQLQADQVFEESSVAEVDVVIHSIRIRHTANAVIFGPLAGTDNIAGIVTLKDTAGKVLTTFSMSAAWPLGGFGESSYPVRLGWLSKRFAESTVNTILGKKTD